MPRKVTRPEDKRRARPSNLGLAGALAEELKSKRESGQPVVEEEHFKTGLIRVNVLWDRWDRVTHEDRAAAILHAYRLAEGPEFAEKITMAGGQTYPEAYASGMLPFQIIPAWRVVDPVSLEQCHQAMIDEGASELFDPGHPQLRFATEEEAEACLRRLVEHLPGSEPVWQVLREIGRDLDLSWEYSA